MDHKMQTLHNDIDTLNPRNRIEQTILPRLARTRELYSVEPEVFTRTGKRVLKKPNLRSIYFFYLFKIILYLKSLKKIFFLSLMN